MIQQEAWQTVLLLVLAAAASTFESWGAGMYLPINGNLSIKTWLGCYFMHVALWWMRREGWGRWSRIGLVVLWFQYANWAFRPHIPQQEALVNYITACFTYWGAVELTWMVVERFLDMTLVTEMGPDPEIASRG